MIKILSAIENTLIILQAGKPPTFNPVNSTWAQIENTLEQFKNDDDSSAELKAADGLAFRALEYKLYFLRKTDAYAVVMILDPKVNKPLTAICNLTKRKFNKIKCQV